MPTVKPPTKTMAARFIETMEPRLFAARLKTRVAGSRGNWNFSPYSLGVYNGMECLLAVIEGRRPKYRRAPKTWHAVNAIRAKPKAKPARSRRP